MIKEALIHEKKFFIEEEEAQASAINSRINGAFVTVLSGRKNGENGYYTYIFSP